jgi:hypothetical protein
VCNDRNCGDKLSGINVVLSDSPTGTELVKVQTDPNGEYTFVLNGSGPQPGNWYAWVVSSQDQRISTVSPVIPLGPGNENDVNACPNTAAFLDFFRP